MGLTTFFFAGAFFAALLGVVFFTAVVFFVLVVFTSFFSLGFSVFSAAFAGCATTELVIKVRVALGRVIPAVERANAEKPTRLIPAYAFTAFL